MTKEHSSGEENFQALYLVTPSHTPKPVSCGWGTRGVDPPFPACARSVQKKETEETPLMTQGLFSLVRILKLEDSCLTPRSSGAQGLKQPRLRRRKLPLPPRPAPGGGR